MSDPRAMNGMADETKMVHARLERWGRWSKDSHLRAWPATTTLSRIIEEGPHGLLCVGQAPEPHMPDDVANVDAVVARLPPEELRVVRAYYTQWAPAEVLARSLRLSVRRFRLVLTRVRIRVMQDLETLEEGIPMGSKR